VDGKVELFKKIHTAFTSLSKDTHRFKVVNAPTRDNLEEYCHLALKTAEEQTEYFMGA
jgi:chloramphenicol O-acetyltransferase type A